MIVLGVNGVSGLFHDASASIVVDNKIITSVEEERFNRKKHTDGIPIKAIEFCLYKAGIEYQDIDHIGYYLQPSELKNNFVDNMIKFHDADREKLEYYSSASERMKNISHDLNKCFGCNKKIPFHFLNHHLVHASSSYFVSGYDKSAVLTIDGSGDRETAAVFEGKGSSLIKKRDILLYPNSIGFIYTIIAEHLGLGWISGPGKLMGLSAFGKKIPHLFDKIVKCSDDLDNLIDIDLSFFNYHIGGNGLSEKGLEIFGPKRNSDEPLERRHFDLAASVQIMLEDIMMHLVKHTKRMLPDTHNLCLAGGIGLNVLSNRKIKDSNLFKNFFVTPPSDDGGTSLGCALYLNSKYNNVSHYDFDVYSGPDIEKDFNIEKFLLQYKDAIIWEKLDDHLIYETATQYLCNNEIIGWVQGKMECGPRALGNRSYLANPCNPDTKAHLNRTVKKREEFRPYAPSVLKEYAEEWFDIDDSPYMLFSATVNKEKRAVIPAVVHIDGSARPQTVAKKSNDRFYNLILEFYKKTGVPVLLNTSLNKHGDPIVNTPGDAILNLLEASFSALFIDNYHIKLK